MKRGLRNNVDDEGTGTLVPEAIGGYVLHVAGVWRCPLAVIELPPRTNGKRRQARFHPTLSCLEPRMKKRCPRLRKCLMDTAQSQRSITGSGISVLACSSACERLVSSFLLPDGTRVSTVCACLPRGFQHVAEGLDGSLADIAKITSCVSAKPSKADRARIVRAFDAIVRHIQDSTRAFVERDSLSDAALETGVVRQETEEILDRLLETPEDRFVLRAVFEGSHETKALCHFDLKCHGNGDADLVPSPETIWRKQPVPGHWVASLKRRKLVYKGVLRESWHGKGPPAADRPDRYSRWDYPSLAGLRRDCAKDDPLIRIVTGTGKLSGQARLILGRLATRVPADSCDINPWCEAKGTCSLFWEKNHNSLPWRHRLTGIELILTDPFPMFDPHRFHIILAAGAMAHRHAIMEQLEDAALRGLPSLTHQEQKQLLRSLLDRCIVNEDARQKGAAFERFTDGLFRLVPGWIVGRRNAKDLAGTKEIDVTVYVEPSMPETRYWHTVFGTKIFIECKNYPKDCRRRSKGSVRCTASRTHASLESPFGILAEHRNRSTDFVEGGGEDRRFGTVGCDPQC
jgi:hypothetical protein